MLTFNGDQFVVAQVERAQIVLGPGAKVRHLPQLVEAEVQTVDIVDRLQEIYR